MVKRSATLLLLALGLLLSSAAAQDLVSINYLTSFSTFGRDAYAYVAKELGFFEEEGLDVAINPGGGTVGVMQLIAAGTADFGPGDAATAFIAIANEGLDLKAVAAVHQHSLAAVEFVAAAPPDLPRLLASKAVDFIGQFVVGRSLIETAAGEPAVILPYSDHLPDLYGNVILARTEMIERQPEVVEAFVRALMRGLQYSIDHPEETGEILARAVDGQDPDIAADEVRIMRDYVLPPDFEGHIGQIDPAKAESMIAMLREAGAITGEVAVDDVFAPGFTGP